MNCPDCANPGVDIIPFVDIDLTGASAFPPFCVSSDAYICPCACIFLVNGDILVHCADNTIPLWWRHVVENIRTDIPGDQITIKQLRDWCKLPAVYIAHRWGHVSGKLEYRPLKRMQPEFWIDKLDYSIIFRQQDIEYVCFNADGSIYYIKLKKG